MGGIHTQEAEPLALVSLLPPLARNVWHLVKCYLCCPPTYKDASLVVHPFRAPNSSGGPLCASPVGVG